MGKLINFPNKNTRSPDPIQLDMQEFKLSQIGDMSDWIVENVKMILFQMGHHDDNKFNDKDLMMLYETVASTLCRYHSIEHPMHDLVEEMITFDEEGNLVEEKPENSEDVILNDFDRL